VSGIRSSSLASSRVVFVYAGAGALRLAPCAPAGAGSTCAAWDDQRCASQSRPLRCGGRLANRRHDWSKVTPWTSSRASRTPALSRMWCRWLRLPPAIRQLAISKLLGAGSARARFVGRHTGQATAIDQPTALIGPYPEMPRRMALRGLRQISAGRPRIWRSRSAPAASTVLERYPPISSTELLDTFSRPCRGVGSTSRPPDSYRPARRPMAGYVRLHEHILEPPPARATRRDRSDDEYSSARRTCKIAHRFASAAGRWCSTGRWRRHLFRSVIMVIADGILGSLSYVPTRPDHNAQNAACAWPPCRWLR